MRMLLFIFFCLFLNTEIWGAEHPAPPAPENIKCPNPRSVAFYLKNLARDLHTLLKSEGKAEIEDIYIPEMTLEVHPYLNSKGFLICAYDDAHKHAKVPLLYIRMAKAHTDLGKIKKPPPKMQQIK